VFTGTAKDYQRESQRRRLATDSRSARATKTYPGRLMQPSGLREATRARPRVVSTVIRD
jgi:hypothetical protein